MIFDKIFGKKAVEVETKEIEAVEEKGLTAAPVMSRGVEVITQNPWSEKKSLTQEEMLAQYKSWSFICARLNSESVASQKLRLYATTSRGQKRIKNFACKEVDKKNYNRLLKSMGKTKPVELIEEIYEHPVLDLLYNVNDFSNYFDNIQMTQLYMDLAGNAYWFIVTDSKGMPTEIHQMRPDYTKVVPGKDKLINGYLYGHTSPSALTTEEVIRFYVPNPTNAYYGKSCIEAGASEVSRNNLYNTYENSQLANNGRPDFVVKYEGTLTAEDQKRLTMEWNRLYASPKNAGKVKIMDANFAIEKLSFNPKDMEYLQGRLFTKKDISSMFGVPYGMLDTSDELKAGLDNVLSYYQRFALRPRLRRIEETLNEQLIPMYDKSGDLFFSFDDPVDDREELKGKLNCEYVKNKIISINEARADINLDPIEGGDMIAGSNVNSVV
jgi:HK97 family phage portal protein